MNPSPIKAADKSSTGDANPFVCIQSLRTRKFKNWNHMVETVSVTITKLGKKFPIKSIKVQLIGARTLPFEFSTLEDFENSAKNDMAQFNPIRDWKHGFEVTIERTDSEFFVE